MEGIHIEIRLDLETLEMPIADIPYEIRYFEPGITDLRMYSLDEYEYSEVPGQLLADIDLNFLSRFSVGEISIHYSDALEEAAATRHLEMLALDSTRYPDEYRESGVLEGFQKLYHLEASIGVLDCRMCHELGVNVHPASNEVEVIKVEVEDQSVDLAMAVEVVLNVSFQTFVFLNRHADGSHDKDLEQDWCSMQYLPHMLMNCQIHVVLGFLDANLRD